MIDKQFVAMMLLLLGNSQAIGCQAAMVQDSVSESHIKANVPEPSAFDNILRRHLESYFADARADPVRIVYELLRDGPTQVGVALPKYYLWVQIFDGGRLLEEGAARVAAIEQTQFEVTHYVPRAEILRRPGDLERTFPKPVADKIRERIKQMPEE